MANQQSGPATSQALAAPQKSEDKYSSLAGTFSKPGGLTARLQWAADNTHLISPATTCGRLPEGCSVAVSVVHLDARVDAHDVGFGKLGLLKHALMRIATAAGIAFDPLASGRLDDATDSHYVHWRAIGAWRHLDGSILPVVGDKEMDLRDGSAQVDRIYANSKEKAKGDKQLMEMRAFIVPHAQSKAELRAIRKALGIRSYTASELERPFVICKLMFTGQSENPRIAEANAAAIRNSMLGGAQALFGPPAGSTVPAQALPAMQNAPVSFGHSPPPVGATRAELDDESGPSLLQGRQEHIDTTGTSVPESSRAPAQAASTSQATKQSPPPAGDVHIVKLGRSKGRPVTDLDAEGLDWYVSVLKDSVDDPKKARWRADNEADYRAVLAERERREGAPPQTTTSAAAKPAAPPPDFDAADRGDSPDDY